MVNFTDTINARCVAGMWVVSLKDGTHVLMTESTFITLAALGTITHEHYIKIEVDK